MTVAVSTTEGATVNVNVLVTVGRGIVVDSGLMTFEVSATGIEEEEDDDVLVTRVKPRPVLLVASDAFFEASPPTTLTLAVKKFVGAPG